MQDDADRACAYVVDRVRRVAGARWAQGDHAPPFVVRGLDGRGERAAGREAVRIVAERRLWRVERAIARGLVAWANGERDVELLTSIPSAREVLALQARGRRCVSLLPDDAAIRPPYGVPADSPDAGLAFVLHDLCHLEKFADPEHHRAQVGFFRTFWGAVRAPAWDAFDARFDDAWRVDVGHVAADMNGSVIFLFAALKMKLKMATRRELARVNGRAAPSGGALDAHEERAYADALEMVFDLFELRGEERDDARAVSTKRDARDAAIGLERAFTARGQPALP